MKLSDFYYEVPSELIALTPIEPRSSARLFFYDRGRSLFKWAPSPELLYFMDLPTLLDFSDVLVVNDTIVLPARFTGVRQTGGSLEGLYITTNMGILTWIKGGVRQNEVIEIHGWGRSKILKRQGERAELDCETKAFEAFLWQKGFTPLPPYIRAERTRRGLPETMVSDKNDYQTCFAKPDASYSIAAPTASLHFDAPLLLALSKKGIEILEIDLRVGEGTFAPIRTEHLQDHSIHTEKVMVSDKIWSKILKYKKEGRRIIAVGTTVVRALESAVRQWEINLPIRSFETNLFIKPPFHFKIVDGLITNFHWPESTLLILLATFLEAGPDGHCGPQLQHHWRKIYQEAIQQKFRLFSYGDGMLIL